MGGKPVTIPAARPVSPTLAGHLKTPGAACRRLCIHSPTVASGPQSQSSFRRQGFV